MTSLDLTQEDLAPEEVRRMHAAGEIELIDVREPREHEAGRIEGARHVQVPELTAAAAELDPERPIVFYCRVGRRSALATQAFRASGFSAFNLGGGIVAWVEAGLPIEGTVADH